MSIYTSALVLAWVAIAVLAFAMAGLLRQVHALTASRTPVPGLGLSAGEAAPSWSESGGPPARDTVALFVDIGCGSCERVLRAADRLAAEQDGRLDFIAFFRGEANGFSPSRLEVVADARSVFDRYKVPVTPFAVIVDNRGRVAEATALGSESALGDLVGKALNTGGNHAADNR